MKSNHLIFPLTSSRPASAHDRARFGFVPCTGPDLGLPDRWGCLELHVARLGGLRDVPLVVPEPLRHLVGGERRWIAAKVVSSPTLVTATPAPPPEGSEPAPPTESTAHCDPNDDPVEGDLVARTCWLALSTGASEPDRYTAWHRVVGSAVGRGPRRTLALVLPDSPAPVVLRTLGKPPRRGSPVSVNARVRVADVPTGLTAYRRIQLEGHCRAVPAADADAAA